MAHAPAAAQTTGHAGIQAAIAAYDAGDLQRALDLLQSPADLVMARDSAIRHLYVGLVHYALGDPARAQQAFLAAVRADHSLRIDPALHAPTRVRSFDEARRTVAQDVRQTAYAAEAQGRPSDALQRWRTVLEILTTDEEATSRIEAIENAERLRATADSIQQSLTQPVSQPAPRWNPGRAFAMGLLLPGLGHMYTGRRARGGLAMAASAGVLIAAYASQRVEVDCRTELVDGVCPAGEVLSQNTRRPYLGAGIAAAAGITILAAIDAMLGARRANSAAERDTVGGSGLALLPPEVQPSRGGAVRVGLIRLRFR